MLAASHEDGVIGGQPLIKQEGDGMSGEEISASAAGRPTADVPDQTQRAACPVCGGPLVEIRMKLQCAQCHTICETCCEGGRG